MNRRAFLAAAAAIGLAMASSTAAQTQKCKLALVAEWPLRAEQYRPVVDGEINGRKIGILLDTGAQMSLVRRSATTKLGLTRYEVEGYRAFGVGGETHAEYVHIDEFRIGKAVRKNWRALVAGEHDFGDEIAVFLGDEVVCRQDEDALPVFGRLDVAVLALGGVNEAEVHAHRILDGRRT